MKYKILNKKYGGTQTDSITFARHYAGVIARKNSRNPKCPVYENGKIIGHVVYNELSEKLFWHYPQKNGVKIYTMYADGRLKSKLR